MTDGKGKDSGMATVVVIFQVDGREQELAEREVEERLWTARLLMHNDSSDFARGTEDPITMYAVVPASKLLEEAL